MFDGTLDDTGGHNGTGFDLSYTADRNEVVNNALVIAGDGYATVASPDDFNFTGDFSISVWIKRGPYGAGSIASKQSAVNYLGWNLWFENGGINLIAGISGNLNIVQTAPIYGDSEWHHLIAVKKGTDANDWRFYVDGQKDTHVVQNDMNAGNITDLTNTGRFLIGARDAGGASFQGTIDDLMIYNRALSESEATGIYTPSNLCANIFCSQEGVGINTGEVPQGYSLAVKGKVIAEGMKVQYQTAWPDYVFDPGYSLPPLEYTKEFIKEHGHLPGVPSAKDVRANGVDVGR
jgi:hypothetical protein